MKAGGVEMFGFDWTGDGKESLIDDLITLKLLGRLDDEDESDEENEDAAGS
ncbi:hypothetical protein [Lachnobacterium bovis]|uniref:hypothetical protein n=1 Tax=Lachnobacterium bovis TaxID=140626 RepID=UPI0012DF1257|nr:hypothetical protein [Lachnobacterium bovis]